MIVGNSQLTESVFSIVLIANAVRSITASLIVSFLKDLIILRLLTLLLITPSK